MNAAGGCTPGQASASSSQARARVIAICSCSSLAGSVLDRVSSTSHDRSWFSPSSTRASRTEAMRRRLATDAELAARSVR